MAKRFTSTVIWQEDWFINLPAKYKLFWFYIKDNCDHAGIWKPNFKIAEFMVEDKIDLKEAVEYFNSEKERIKILPNNRWLICDFFKFQYSEKGTLDIKNNAHKSVKKVYEDNGINNLEELGIFLKISDLSDTPATPPRQELPAHKDKDKDKDRIVDKEYLLKLKIESIVSYLNKKSGKGFSPKKPKTIQSITARLNEGHTEEEFKKVIDNKAKDWIGTEQEKYLRPETLFGTKFESYLYQQSSPEKITAKSQGEQQAYDLKRLQEDLGAHKFQQLKTLQKLPGYAAGHSVYSS